MSNPILCLKSIVFGVSNDPTARLGAPCANSLYERRHIRLLAPSEAPHDPNGEVDEVPATAAGTLEECT